jgi:surface polysaccharide O-acyltransferase-like enzyme
MNIARTIDLGVEECDRSATTAARSACSKPASTHDWINTIQLYRFPLGLAVVAVHTGEFALSVAGKGEPGSMAGGFGQWLVEFLTLAARLATPAFLVIAGLVFFRDGRVSFDGYRRKLKSRVYTLLVPYLAWNFMAILLFCAPSAYKHFFLPPGTYTFAPLSFGGLATWLVGWPVYPADAPLWFVRDLLFLIVIVPLLSMIPRRLQVVGLVVLLFYWLLGPVDLVPGGIPRAASAFFFLAGAWLGRNQVLLRPGPAANRITVISAVVFLVSAAAGASCNTIGGDHAATQLIFDRLVRLSGAVMVVCAGSLASIPAWLSGPLRRFSPAAFFLFAFHYCVFVCLTGVFGRFAPERLGTGRELLVFGLVFATVIAISLACYVFLKRHAPSLLGLLDGNRSARCSVGRRTEKLVAVSPVPILAPRPSSFSLPQQNATIGMN